MDFRRAEQIAFEIMNQYGLLGMGVGYWKFDWMRARKTYGLCDHGTHTISLSMPLTLINSEATIRDVILHEVAHALVGARHGHNRVWWLKAKSMGCSATRCTTGVKVQSGGWIGHCPNREHEHRMFRKPTRSYSCGKCSRENFKSGYQAEYAIVWKRAPRRAKGLTDTAR